MAQSSARWCRFGLMHARDVGRFVAAYEQMLSALRCGVSAVRSTADDWLAAQLALLSAPGTAG
jgi:hypothetical protein